MAQPEFQQRIIKAFREQVMPKVREGNAHLAFGRPPLQAPAGIEITSEATPLLAKNRKRQSYIQTSSWPEVGLHMSRYPLIIYVLDGEADFRIGVTKDMAAAIGQDDLSGSYVVSMPRDTLLLIPQGVPYSDASRPHWERPHLEQARSQLLWVHLLPAGTSLHTCTTEGLSHILSPSLFVGDSDLLQLTNSLTDEWQRRSRHSLTIATRFLEILLLRIDRGFAQRQVLTPEEKARLFSGQGDIPGERKSSQEAIVNRACQYIQTNLNKPLSLQQIASHAYVSATHLNRLFNLELGMTAMEFVTRQRLELAESLLQDTNFPIRHISSYVGYPQVTHFSRSFKQHLGVSPAYYRRGRRWDVEKK